MTSREDPLLRPLELGPLRLRNRILSTAHAPALAEAGHPRDRYRAYHVEKARGGVALTMIGGSTNVSPDSPSVFGQLYAGDDGILPWFRKLTDDVKTEGAAVMCQLTHMGRRTVWDDGDWLPVIGPSPSRERAHRAIPKEMDEADIARVMRDFAAAAIRCRTAGFDGVEILAHGHLPGQFLSPLVNRRRDAWGGDLEKRARFLIELVKRVREAIGPDLALGVRMTGDERTEAGLSAEDCVEVARLLEGTGALSFLDVIAGAPYDNLGLAAWVPPMGMQDLGHLESAAAIRAAVFLPVFVAGGVNDLATARFALTEGAADMVGMTRSQIADPWLVAKLQAGREDRIRPCVGLGYCVDRVNKGRAAVCGHNVAAGRERTIPHLVNPEAELGAGVPSAPAARPRVVIVGGGPAGMEAARVAALRGHDVTLFEAAPRLGGQLLLAAQSQTRRQVRSVAEWLEAEIVRAGVTVRLNTYAEAADVLALDPDTVIVATGGLPAEAPFAGAELTRAGWEVLDGSTRPHGTIVIHDEVGTQAAAAAAERCIGRAERILYVTPDEMPLAEMGVTTRAVAMRRLLEGGVEFLPNSEITRVAAAGNRRTVTIANTLTGVRTEKTADLVLTEYGTIPLDEVFQDLRGASSNDGLTGMARVSEDRVDFRDVRGGSFRLARIGDAVASRDMHAALLEARRIALSLPDDP